MSNKRAGMPLQPSLSPGQKRSRPAAATASGADVIEIRGVPPHVTPLLVEALRTATQFFQHAKEATVPGTETNEEHQAQLAATHGGVVDSLMTRMEASSAETSEREKQIKKRERMDQDMQTLVEAIRHEARDSRHYNIKASSVPVSCLIYVNDLMQTHGRVAVRRAALHLCGILLTKSSECRVFMLEEKEHLLDWIESVVTAPQFSQWRNPDHAATQIPMLQQETMQWLTQLSDKFTLHYPKLRVARRYIQQHCPDIATTDASTTISASSYNTMQLRRFRDLALQHGDKECQRVQRLVQRAQTCLDVLVPRFGQETNEIVNEQKTEIENDDFESDVDWEDGDVDALDGEEVSNDIGQEDLHAAAVEQTLAAMEQTGGLLQSGTLEIRFDEKSNARDDKPESVVATDMVMKEKLQKVVDRLSSRHMPRLTAWVEGLIKADGLRQAKGEGSSLVLLPVELAQKRGRVLQALFDAKSSVASVLASAKRLEITVSSGEQQQQSATNRLLPVPHSSTPSSGSRARISQISSSRRTQQNVAGQRSNRIQIKYRTS